MLKNFILVTLRNLRRNSLYSFINISGLSIGIACSILILLWVKNQTSFDKFIPKSDRLYQVWVNADYNGTINSWNSVPLPSYEAMKNADANIVNSAVSGWGGNRLLTVGETRLMQDGYFASNEFLEMFEFPMVIGDRSEVLDDPASIVISEKLSDLLFKGADPIGELVRLDDASTLKVTGVFKDLPQNSSFQFDYVIPWKHREAIEEWVRDNKNNWGNYSFQVFVELTDPASEDKVEASIKDMLIENGQDDMPRAFFLHPMLRWRLHTNFENGKESGGMHEYVTLFTVIAMFIIIIACINFMNLATARSERRAKEVGVRKSLGSTRSQLIFQFYGESLVISLISFVLALFLMQLALPAYNNLVDLKLSIDYTSSEFWLFALAIIFLTGVISGSYPSLYLSSFNPVKTLKGKVNIGKNANTPRKVLVMLQFGFAVILVISTIVIVKQIDLAKNRDLGYSQEGLITIPYTDALAENYNVLKNDLLASGVVESITRSNSAVTSINSNNFLSWPGKPESQKVLFVTIATEYDYAKTVGAEMLYGRDFSKEFASDSSAIVINKAALDLMELEDPIGTQLDLWGGKRTLIGVIDNILMGSPYDEVRPLFMVMDPEWVNAITVRLSATNDLSGTMNTVQEIFEKHNPAYPFESRFVDVDFERKYTEINLTRELSMLFAGLTIFITGLGLFGLASYTAEQRIKEIGIRKVLGASVSNLVGLMSVDFAKLVLIAFVVAAPVAYFLLDNYLQRYPIRTTIDWWIFAITGAVALIFALVVVVNQARRAALANPVKSLRSE
ncbi:ABC transporter permease [Roseivirga sp.]|uniref:ABC transporter permease n=1 Tax=Roseivirga sp. TaxID=1964215 RepID=UPI002B26E679|nr:ABC transporter permease [Roseivirga sp.]